jgi:CelD/BcsL family acetyltransferase involved in cellulose biosynthesis
LTVASGDNGTWRHSPPQSSSASAAETPQGLTVHREWGTVRLIEAIEDEWRELCREGPCNAPFFRPEWIAASIRAFAPQQRLLLITVREHGRLTAVIPLLEEKIVRYGLRFIKLRGAANVQHSCRFDLIYGDCDDVGKIVRTVWSCLRSLPDWHVVEVPIVPQGGAAEGLLNAAQEKGFPIFRFTQRQSPYILLTRDESANDFSRFAVNAHFRQNLRRRWRKLEANGPLTLRRLEKGDASALQQFYRLEQSGWKGRKGTAIACSKQLREFYDSVAQSAERFGYLSLYFLEQNDSVIAAQFGLTCNGCYWLLKVGYDENYAEYGPGHLMTWAVLRDCLERGLSQIDFLGQSAKWKSEWASEVRPHDMCYIFRNNLAGRFLNADTRQHRRLQMVADKLLARVAALRPYFSGKMAKITGR